MAKNAEKATTKKQATATGKRAAMKQGNRTTQISPEVLEEATKLAIKVHWQALKELEKH